MYGAGISDAPASHLFNSDNYIVLYDVFSVHYYNCLTRLSFWPGYCAYLDIENAMDPSLAESMGVNTENLLFSNPNSAENVLNVVDTLTKSGSLDVIVLDSVSD